MPPLPPQNMIDIWTKEKKCNFALDTYYVSNLSNEDIKQVDMAYLSSVIGDTCFLQIVEQEGEDPNIQPWITQFFKKAFTLTADKKIRTMSGRYLRVIFAYEKEEQLIYADEYITQAVNLLRMKFGIGCAVERAEAIFHDFAKNTHARSSSPNILWAGGDGREGNSFFQNSVTSGFFKNGSANLHPDASIFLDQAIESHNRNHRFLFLWMALEAQIGMGNERASFCKNDLKSEKISEEMKRMHEIRSKYAHNLEKISDEEINIAIGNTLELLRISALPAGKIRTNLVRSFEDNLDKKK